MHFVVVLECLVIQMHYVILEIDELIDVRPVSVGWERVSIAMLGRLKRKIWCENCSSCSSIWIDGHCDIDSILVG